MTIDENALRNFGGSEPEPDPDVVLGRVAQRVERRRRRHRMMLSTSLAVVAVVILGAGVLGVRHDTPTQTPTGPAPETTEANPTATTEPDPTTTTETTAAPTTVPTVTGPAQRVVVDGLEPGTPVRIVQCANADGAGGTCTYGNSVPWRADASGTVTADAPITEWIFSAIGWTRCAPEPCQLMVLVGTGYDPYFVPVTYQFDPPTPQPNPQLELTSPPTAAGSEISFSITGLPADMSYEVFLCARTEAGPGPVPKGGDQKTFCVGSRNSIALADADGAVSMTGFVLPQLDCAEANRCWIGSWPVRGGAPIVATPITYPPA